MVAKLVICSPVMSFRSPKRSLEFALPVQLHLRPCGETARNGPEKAVWQENDPTADPCRAPWGLQTLRSTALVGRVTLRALVAPLDAVDELSDLHRTRQHRGSKSGVQEQCTMQHAAAELKQAGRSHSSGRLAQQWGGAGRLAGLRRRRGEGVPRSPLGAERADGGSSPSLAALARLGAGTRYAKLRGPPLSPTSCQHAYESAVLALGLTSCPPNPQAGAHHGAIIAIPTAVRRAMHFGGRARAFFMRGRRGQIRHWRPCLLYTSPSPRDS